MYKGKMYGVLADAFCPLQTFLRQKTKKIYIYKERERVEWQ